MRGLKDEMAPATGAANDNGRAVARRLAAERHTMGILDIDEPDARGGAPEIQTQGGDAEVEVVVTRLVLTPLSTIP